MMTIYIEPPDVQFYLLLPDEGGYSLRLSFVIPLNYVEAAHVGVDQLIQSLDLLILRTPTTRNTLVNRTLEQNSKCAHERQFRGLRYYCCLIGDYERLLMLGGWAFEQHRTTFFGSIHELQDVS